MLSYSNQSLFDSHVLSNTWCALLKELYVFFLISHIPNLSSAERIRFRRTRVDVNLKNDGGRTTLHYATSKGWVRAKILLSNGAKIEAKDKIGNTRSRWIIVSTKVAMLQWYM
ncbi:putative ankyrin repeat-containing domain-containing protein [Helianthus annuus]|uniref:Ankyrin repeat-containing domain-containing protein n=1 Tax=Helianthus annuus TaxID=4232 RepID=A0A251S4F2_HELAN|nr:putative ankyrin repeat-containing domain-containing protein [Helianthus annuus]KAJ0821776.1 putative ankyrin repeat-containing domain-containing protein [Helianthus annuus]